MDSAPEKSGFYVENQKDAEGVKPERVNLSGKRTEKKVLNDFFVRSFCISETPFFILLSAKKGRK